MQALFPESDVKTQMGIDVRQSPTKLLFAADIITHTVAHTVDNKRKWSHEVGTKGAIGLASAGLYCCWKRPL